MNADNLRKNAGRWVRVGVFTLTTLGPIINVVASNLRKRTAELQQEAAKRGQTTLSTLSALPPPQEQLLAIGASLSDTLNELKEKPYSQELLKRSSELTETLREQGDKLSQVVAERGGDIARDVATRSRIVSRELAKQSKQTSREVSRRTQLAAQQAQRELARRGAQVSAQVHAQTQRPDYMARFWSVFGFSVGLTSAAVAFYMLLMRRLQRLRREGEPIQLMNRSLLNGASTTTNKTALSTPPATALPTVDSSVDTAPSLVVEDVPADAPFLNATGTPLSANVDATDNAPIATSDALAVEVPVESVVVPTETPLETEEPMAAQETPQVLETPISVETPEDEAAVISTGLPIVSIDETVVPADSLGTAMVSGVVGEDDSPTVKQAAVSNALQDIPTQPLQASASEEVPTPAPLFMGVVATKHYYPVETPLSQLHAQEGSGVEIVYFASENDAKTQGYSVHNV